MVRYLCLAALLTAAFGAELSPRKACDANVDCDIVFKTQEYGVDILLRNFEDPNGYVAFVIDNQSQNRQEFLVCIPHEQRRLRGISLMGLDILPMDKYETRGIRKVGENDFVCTFFHNELTNYFRRQKEIFTVEGRIIGTKFHDYTYQMLPILPIGEHISVISDTIEDVVSPNEKKMASDLVGKVRRIGGKKDLDEDDIEAILDIKKTALDTLDKELEQMLEDQKKFSTRRLEEEAEYFKRRAQQDKEEKEDALKDAEEEYRPRRRGQPIRYEDELDDEEDDESSDADDEDEEDEFDVKPKRAGNKKEKGAKKEPKKTEVEVVEDVYDLDIERGDFEDEKKSCSHSFVSIVSLFVVGYFMLH